MTPENLSHRLEYRGDTLTYSFPYHNAEGNDTTKVQGRQTPTMPIERSNPLPSAKNQAATPNEIRLMPAVGVANAATRREKELQDTVQQFTEELKSTQTNLATTQLDLQKAWKENALLKARAECNDVKIPKGIINVLEDGLMEKLSLGYDMDSEDDVQVDDGMNVGFGQIGSESVSLSKGQWWVGLDLETQAKMEALESTLAELENKVAMAEEKKKARDSSGEGFKLAEGSTSENVEEPKGGSKRSREEAVLDAESLIEEVEELRRKIRRFVK